MGGCDCCRCTACLLSLRLVVISHMFLSLISILGIRHLTVRLDEISPWRNKRTTTCSSYCYDALCTVRRVNSLIHKFLQHRELLKEIGPELRHVFAKFRLETWTMCRQVQLIANILASYLMFVVNLSSTSSFALELTGWDRVQLQLDMHSKVEMHVSLPMED